MPKLILLCVANSARSQMGEALARVTAPSGWEVYSAGSKPTQVNPMAIEAMQEIGIDMTGHRSKGLDEVPIEDADFVITLCAEEECPVAFTRGTRLAWPHPDPAAPAASGDAQLESFRNVRDMIDERLKRFWEERQG
ncbi:MAG: arsenate reductase ArsC [Gemmatimonadales bacterium]|jgi:arsenate reductase